MNAHDRRLEDERDAEAQRFEDEGEALAAVLTEQYLQAHLDAELGNEPDFWL